MSDSLRNAGLRVISRREDTTPPPHDDQLEAALIATLMYSAECIDETMAAGVTDAFFYRYQYRMLYRAILRMRFARIAVDMVTLPAELRQAGELDEVGGDATLVDLFERPAQVVNIQSYIAQLRKMYTLRNREASAIEAVRLIQSGDDERAMELLKKAAKTTKEEREAQKEAAEEIPAAPHLTPRAPAHSLPALADAELAALVRGLKRLRLLSEEPLTATAEDWVAGLVYLVPFEDGRARGLAYSEQRGAHHAIEAFDAAWAEALKLYNRPDRAGAASISQKIVEHLAAGGLEGMLPISHGYGIHEGAFVRRRMEFKNGRWIENPPVVLTNFIAWVVSQEFQDDGTGVAQRRLRIGGQAAWGAPLPEFDIDAEEWTNMSAWLHKNWGHTVVIFNRKTNGQPVLEAMALFSMEAPVRHVYTHSGWVKTGGKHVFLTPGGAIGLAGDEATDFAKNASVTLPNVYRFYRIPTTVTRQEAIDGYRWLERFMRVADLSITAPMVSALFLAPLASLVKLNFILAFTGPSDSRKSSLVAAAMAAWGRDIDSDSLPMSFMHTKNAIENSAFSGKDMPIVVDNYVPSINPEHARTLQGLAHSIGDGQGRARMLDGHRSLAAKPCRGLMIITGEENCEQYSGSARMYVVPMNRGSITLPDLTAVQIAARQGKLEPAMTHYLGWLAGRMQDPAFADTLKARWFELARKEQEGSSNHGRLVAQRKWIDIGLELAAESHPAGRWTDQRLSVDAVSSLDTAAGERGYTLKESSIVATFLRSIKLLIDSGVIVAVDSKRAGHPPNIHADVFGWVTNSVGVGIRKAFEKSEVALWVDKDADAPQTSQWFVYVNADKMMRVIRKELPDTMADSVSAVSTALEGEGMLWLNKSARLRGNRAVPFTLPGASRQRVIRIKGEMMIKSLGFDDKEQE